MKRIGCILLLSLLMALALSVTAAAEEVQGEITMGEILPFYGYSSHDQDAVQLQEEPKLSTKQREQLIQKLYAGLLAEKEEIDITEFGLTINELSELSSINQWIYDSYPELFYIGEWSYSHIGPRIIGFYPIYKMTGRELQEARAFYRTELEKILEPVDETWSDLEKVLYFNGYLASHYRYDPTIGLDSYDVYHFLKNKEGVCQAYYLTCKALLDACGIPSTYAKSETAKHIWNVLQLDGKWYHLDVTWNDPIRPISKEWPEDFRNEAAVDAFGQAKYDYFLLSENTLHGRDSENGQNRTDVVYGDTVSCTDASYENACWSPVSSPYVRIGDKWYYNGADGIFETSDVTRPGRVLIRDKWPALGYPPGYMWPTSCSGLGTYAGWLIYNSSDQIKGYHPLTGETKIFFTTQTDAKDIYGIQVDGNEVTYWLDNSPNCSTNCPTAELGSILLTELEGGQFKKYGGVTVSEKDGRVTIMGTPKTQEPFYILATGRTEAGKQKSVQLISSADLPDTGLQWQMEGDTVKLFLLSNKYVPLD